MATHAGDQKARANRPAFWMEMPEKTTIIGTIGTMNVTATAVSPLAYNFKSWIVEGGKPFENSGFCACGKYGRIEDRHDVIGVRERRHVSDSASTI